jgi:V8-like Glu-specific endopeptidase
MRTSLLFMGLLIVNTITVSALTKIEPNVLFGEDNRHEVFETDPEWQEIAQSIAGKVTYDHIIDHKSYWELQGVPLNRRVCKENRYAEQVTVPSCSGFLVKPNILITAGHCMRTPEDCTNQVWVFGYMLKNAADSDYRKVGADQVYKCKQVLGRRQEDFGAVDYTIVELDRPVVGRKPLTLGFQTAISVGQQVAALGHPNGLPMKFADAASIIAITSNDRSIEADLDQFQGNSGSPIFDVQTKTVIGIASHGHADYVREPEKLCKIPKVCMPEDKCYLSASSRVTNLLVEPIFKNSQQP